jgi:exopolysaccharide biosynthesis protein
LSTALQLFQSTRQQLRDWSWFKRSLLLFTILTFMVSSFLFLTSPGTDMRIWMANSVIITQHREWAWIFVGTEQRDAMVRTMHKFIEDNSEEKQEFGLIKHQQSPSVTRKNRSIDELIKVEDISGTFWKGKRMYVFDPKTIRLMTPVKTGEGEKISAMVQRTGAVAGVNAGGFDDPEGLGNGFAAIGAIISGGEVIYTDQDSNTPQHIVGFTKDGTLVIGKYNMFELKDMGISEAASFYPRVIANGKPLPINDVSRAPRTAVAQKADGTIIFIVVDGRQTHSVGATLKEIQDLFLADDVVNAGFLDGGASSELVVNGELVTKPSSRYGERRLPSAYLIYDHPEDAVANRVWDGLTSINAGGAFDHPDFLKEQAQKKANQKNNPAAAVTPAPAKTVEPDKTKTQEAGTGTGSSKPAAIDSTKSAGQTETTKPAQSTDVKDTNGSKTTSTPTAGGAKDAANPAAGGSSVIDPLKAAEGGSKGNGTAGTTTPPANTTTPTTGGTVQPSATPGAGSAPAASGSTSVPSTGTSVPAAGDAGSKTTVPPTTSPTPSGDTGTKNAPASSPTDAVKNVTPTTTAVSSSSSDAATKNATPAASSGDTSKSTTAPAGAASTTTTTPAAAANPTTP